MFLDYQCLFLANLLINLNTKFWSKSIEEWVYFPFSLYFIWIVSIDSFKIRRMPFVVALKHS